MRKRATKLKASYLSFKLLEDVMNLPARSRDELIAQTTILRIGPLVILFDGRVPMGGLSSNSLTQSASNSLLKECADQVS